MMTSMKKAWYIEGYTMNGATYCRDCLAESLDDESLSNPYTQDDIPGWTPIFASDVTAEELEDLYCEYCFEPLDKSSST